MNIDVAVLATTSLSEFVQHPSDLAGRQQLLHWNKGGIDLGPLLLHKLGQASSMALGYEATGEAR